MQRTWRSATKRTEKPAGPDDLNTAATASPAPPSSTTRALRGRSARLLLEWRGRRGGGGAASACCCCSPTSLRGRSRVGVRMVACVSTRLRPAAESCVRVPCSTAPLPLPLSSTVMGCCSREGRSAVHRSRLLPTPRFPSAAARPPPPLDLAAAAPRAAEGGGGVGASEGERVAEGISAATAVEAGSMLDCIRERRAAQCRAVEGSGRGARRRAHVQTRTARELLHTEQLSSASLDSSWCCDVRSHVCASLDAGGWWTDECTEQPCRTGAVRYGDAVTGRPLLCGVAHSAMFGAAVGSWPLNALATQHSHVHHLRTARHAANRLATSACGARA